MIIEMKIVNPITYNEDTIKLKLEYPIIEYYNWKRLTDYKNNEDICKILDNKLQDLNCTKKYNEKLIRTINDGIYSIILNEYFYYLVKLTNQFIYNEYFDKLINCHIDNILFEITDNAMQTIVKQYPKSKRKRPENKFVKYTTIDIFTGKETYIYENLRTLEKINSDNPNLLEELNTPKKKKVSKKKEIGVPISSITFSFKKEK